MQHKTIKSLVFSLITAAVIGTAASAQTLYAPGGRTIDVPENEVAVWKTVGWAEDVTIYAPDGRTASIPSFLLDDYLAVGWYEIPVVKLYAYDGRTAVVAASEKDAFLAVGWFADITETCHTLYAPDTVKMKTISVLPNEVAAYLACGWFETLTEAVDAGVTDFGLYHAYTALLKYVDNDRLHPEVTRMLGVIRAEAGSDLYTEKLRIERNGGTPVFKFDCVFCGEVPLDQVGFECDFLNATGNVIYHHFYYYDFDLTYGNSATVSLNLDDYPTVSSVSGFYIWGLQYTDGSFCRFDPNGALVYSVPSK